MVERKTDKICVLDFVIEVLRQHEENLSEEINRLEEAVNRLNERIGAEQKRTEALLRFYEPIKA